MKKEIFAKLSVILGIVSVSFSAVECFFPLIIVGIVLGAVAIVFGIMAIKEFKNQSISGIILGITGIIASSVWLYLALAVK